MKKLICLFISFVLSLVLLASPALAYNPHDYYDWLNVADARVLGETTETTTPESFDRYLFLGDATPDQPFYFLKRTQESAQLALTFNQTAKAQLELQIAGERLNEIDQLVIQGKTDNLDSALKNYAKLLESVTKKIKTLEDQTLLSNFDMEAAKQNLALENVLLAVPKETQPQIQTGLNATYKVSDTLADRQKKPPIPPELMSRLLSLQAQGLITQPEVDRIASYDSKVKVREELNKYVKSGIVPEADFVKLNDSVQAYFPEKFAQSVENRKFLELERLETEKPDENTLRQIQDFSKNYQPGDVIPAHLKQDWNKVVRLEELQNTFQPQLVDFNQFQNIEERKTKFGEMVNRYQPREEDMKRIETLKQSGQTLPLELQRIEAISQSFGTNKAAPPKSEACPSNAHWNQAGYCIPNITYPATQSKDVQIMYQNYYKDYQLPEGVPPPNAPTYTPGQYPSPVYAPGVPDPTQTPPGLNQPDRPQLQPVNNPPPSGQGSCPPGSSWNGSTCHFPPPPSGESGPPPSANNPPTNNPPPNNPPPNNPPPPEPAPPPPTP